MFESCLRNQKPLKVKTLLSAVCLYAYFFWGGRLDIHDYFRPIHLPLICRYNIYIQEMPGQQQNPVEVLRISESKKILGTQFGQSEKEEWNVRHSPELASECFDFGIERFCSCICGPVYEVVQDSIIVIAESLGDCAELSSVHFIHFVIPPGKI